jgi:putative peptide zinc metalloprotease protein
MSGGEVPVDVEDPQKAVEPFFEVHADVAADADAAILHGRSGKIRFDLEAEPLLPRWIRRLQQLLQKRYQL